VHPRVAKTPIGEPAKRHGGIVDGRQGPQIRIADAADVRSGA
jgi:hypothetical protein